MQFQAVTEQEPGTYFVCLLCADREWPRVGGRDMDGKWYMVEGQGGSVPFTPTQFAPITHGIQKAHSQGDKL